MTTPHTPMHMIRADLDISAFHRWAGSRDLIAQNTFDVGYALHCLLVESFGSDLAPKPFRAMISRPPPGQRRHGTFYGYAQCDAAALRTAAAMYADPLQSKILPAPRIESKPMPTTWQPGQRLGFEVLIRPVVRPKERRLKTRDGIRHPGAETDVWQWEASQHPQRTMARSREDVYIEWLAAQLARRGGAELENSATSLQSFQRVRTVRKRRSHATEGPHAVLQGTLVVTDVDAFPRLVAHGIGRHRAYGYGMLLLRPPRLATNL